MISDDPFINDLLRIASRNTRDRTHAQSTPLVTSGGWCAPSEPVYDPHNIDYRSGMLDLPRVQVRRGGVKWDRRAFIRPVPEYLSNCPSFGLPIDGFQPLNLGLWL